MRSSYRGLVSSLISTSTPTDLFFKFQTYSFTIKLVQNTFSNFFTWAVFLHSTCYHTLMCEIAEKVNQTRGVSSQSTAAPEIQHERFVENMTHPFLGSHGLLFSNDGGLYFCNISDNLLKDCKTFLFLGIQLALEKDFNPASLKSKQVKKNNTPAPKNKLRLQRNRLRTNAALVGFCC